MSILERLFGSFGLAIFVILAFAFIMSIFWMPYVLYLLISLVTTNDIIRMPIVGFLGVVWFFFVQSYAQGSGMG